MLCIYTFIHVHAPISASCAGNFACVNDTYVHTQHINRSAGGWKEPVLDDVKRRDPAVNACATILRQVDARICMHVHVKIAGAFVSVQWRSILIDAFGVHVVDLF